MNDFLKPHLPADKVERSADKAADAVRDGVQSAEKSVNDAFGKVADKTDEFRNDAAPALERFGDQAQQLAQHGRQFLQDTTQRARDKAVDLSDKAVAYTKDEPVKAMLMSAAAGAVLMSLVSMMGRSRR